MQSRSVVRGSRCSCRSAPLMRRVIWMAPALFGSSAFAAGGGGGAASRGVLPPPAPPPRQPRSPWLRPRFLSFAGMLAGLESAVAAEDHRAQSPPSWANLGESRCCRKRHALDPFDRAHPTTKHGGLSRHSNRLPFFRGGDRELRAALALRDWRRFKPIDRSLSTASCTLPWPSTPHLTQMNLNTLRLKCEE